MINLVLEVLVSNETLTGTRNSNVFSMSLISYTLGGLLIGIKLKFFSKLICHLNLLIFLFRGNLQNLGQKNSTKLLQNFPYFQNSALSLVERDFQILFIWFIWFPLRLFFCW